MSEITITKRQRSYTLFLLVVVFTSSHIDRQIVAILQEPIKQAFQISDTQLGLLTGVMFAVFYATPSMPMAVWADRRNRPATLGGVYLGTNFAMLQSQLPVEMRAVGAAINLFVLNIIGLGLGPLSVGIISDATAASDGGDSIRNGLLVMVWSAVHQARVGQLLARPASI